MDTEDLPGLLTRDPFTPFRIRLTSGDHYDVRAPFSVAMMKSRLFIALPNSDRSVIVPYQHIAALETLTGARNGRTTRRKRKQS